LQSPSRLWIAALRLPRPVLDYLDEHGFPIRYSYVKQPWPISMYQTVFATEPGSAEMPSAGRPFTPELVTTLVSAGVQFAPLCCTPASPAWSSTNRRTKSSIACRATPPNASTWRDATGAGSLPLVPPSCARSKR
jgi:hypothetical protein